MSFLASGTRLGPYEIVSRVGAGGMGEVYRARDTRLDRTVAVKVLPARLSSDAEARARFEREARAISALNDPHICTLHDVGSEGNVAYLVMELLEGETLADVLARGKLPLDRALRYGIEIAGALDRAHRQGIIHRDLKPGNIMITRSGVKLLDFGLARLHATSAAGHDAPTVVSPITTEGTILGTLQYMSPEQLEGKPTDARTDVFSFGCILYEMITGRRAFDGSSQASIITAIMSTEPPPIVSLAPVTPPALERLVRKCLAKDSDDRWQSAGDLVTELHWIVEQAPATEAPTSRRSILPWLIAAAAVLTSIALALFLPSRRADDHPIRLTLQLDADRLDSFGLERELAVSPDGQYLVYVGKHKGQESLWLRRLSDAEAAPIPNTETARAPFWSPDSRQIAFLRIGKLMRTTIRGDETASICDLLPGTYVHGTWGRDGTIVFAYLGERRSLFRVPARGGQPQSIAPPLVPPNTTFCWPTFIGDSKRIAYCTFQRGGDVRLHIMSLESGKDRDLGPTDSRVEIVDDVMLYAREGSLFAQRIDSGLQRIGEPVLLASSVDNYVTLGSALYSATERALVFAGGHTEAHAAWFDRQGNILGTIGPSGARGSLRISHDGRKFVMQVRDPATGTSDLWIHDIVRNTGMRVTNTRLSEANAVWSPDDQMLAYAYEVDGAPHIYKQRANGGEAIRITAPSGVQGVTDWTPDGKHLLFAELNPTTRRDLWLVPPQTDAKRVAWLRSPFFEGSARISPNGKWVAFVSDASGRREVYVSPFDNPGERFQISSNGGEQPVWRRDGAEIFYRTDQRQMYAVSVRVTPTFETGEPLLLFREPASAEWMGYDVTADGQKFIITRMVSGPQTNPLNVIVNWKTLLEKR